MVPPSRTGLGVAALALAGAFAVVPAAHAAAQSVPAAAQVTVIPLPTVHVTPVCGPNNDVLQIDPEWLATWGDKVVIYENSLRFQGGADGDTAKPAGQIRSEYRATYRWARSSDTGWDRWSLYPGTVTPVVDRDTPCPVAPAQLTQTAVCGPSNDTVDFADAASAEHWMIRDRRWFGSSLVVLLETRPGYVDQDGHTASMQVFTDDGGCSTTLEPAPVNPSQAS